MTWLMLMLMLVLSLASSAGAQTRGALETPRQEGLESGIGLIRGWVCEAQNVSVLIRTNYDVSNPSRPRPSARTTEFFLPMPYGTARGDTLRACGDTNNGFATQVNWNLLGDGWHAACLFVDGRPPSTCTVFHVSTLGEEFVRGATRSRCTVVQDFPSPGESVFLYWEESKQNFVINNLCSY